jgi:hypothetical protein
MLLQLEGRLQRLTVVAVLLLRLQQQGWLH